MQKVRLVIFGSLSLACIGVSLSCVSASSERGVEKRWSSAASNEVGGDWKVGETSKSQILKELGPPSQVVSLGDETVFYYLRENMQVKGLVLIVFNNVRVSAEYDRAIFFFNKQGVLSDMAVSEASASGAPQE